MRMSPVFIGREEWMNMENAIENNFWWSIELEADASMTASSAEEALLTVADLSGCIGSELIEETGRPLLRAAYRSSEDISHWLAVLDGLLHNFTGMRVRAHSRIENQPWHTNHLDAFPPLPVGDTLIVMAPWHKGKEPAGKQPLYIYPSSAFGTGYHETTQIALTLVEKFVKSGDTFIDVGTGSGVLFIAALKLGASLAVARDLDPTVISEALRNMELNGLPYEHCDLRVGDLLKGVEAEAEVLTANILLEPNLELLSDVRRVLKPNGVAVFSGMTVAEREQFVPALEAAGLSVIAELTKNNWWGCAAKVV